MRILITGITGYIGSNLARKLLPNHQVFGVVRQPLNTEYIHDIQQQLTLLSYDGSGQELVKQIQMCKPDLVYHLATYYTGAHTMEHVEKMIESNIAFGARLLESMAVSGCKNLIYTATVMQNYRSEPYCPLNFYAATKRAFEDLMAYYADAGFLRYGTVVLSDTYGPGDKRPKIMNLVRNAAFTHTSVDLSDGSQDYAVVHIDDVVKALDMAGQQLCLGQWKNCTYQIQPKEILSLRDTIEMMIALQGLDVQLNWGVRDNPSRFMKDAVTVFPPVPDWQAEVSLEQGLKLV